MTSRVNILVFEYEPLFTDGRVVRVKSLINYLLDIGVQVSLFSLGDRNSVQRTNEFVHHQIKYPGMGRVNKAGDSNAPRHNRWINDIIKSVGRLVFPDRYVFSLVSIVGRLRSELADGDILIISMPWFSSIILCAFPMLLAKRINMVLDYRDLWSNNPIFVHGAVRRLFARWIERRALSRARLVAVTTVGAKEYFARMGYHAIHISNGITQADMNGILKQCPNRIGGTSNTEPTVLGYFGVLGGNRDCLNLLKLLFENRLALRVYGRLDTEHLLACQDSFKGSLSREDCFVEASRCDALMVVIRKAENSDYAIPGKIYESIAMRKPIILYCPTEALALTYLRDIEYPHLHIDSEDDGIINYSLITQILKFYGTYAGRELRGEWAVPIREREYERLLDILVERNLIQFDKGTLQTKGSFEGVCQS